MLIVSCYSAPFPLGAFFAFITSIRIDNDSEEDAGETDTKQPLGCWSGMLVACHLCLAR